MAGNSTSNQAVFRRQTGKNDRIDSRDIALYACRYREKAIAYRLPDRQLKALELLFSFGERLLRNRHTLSVSSKEARAVLQRDATARYIYEQSKRDTERMNGEIKDIEVKMTVIEPVEIWK